MRLSQVNKILLGSCIVVVPRAFISFACASLTPLPCLMFSVSFYGGLAIKEYYLSKELGKVDDSRPPPHERAMRARIVQCVLSSLFSGWTLSLILGQKVGARTPRASERRSKSGYKNSWHSETYGGVIWQHKKSSSLLLLYPAPKPQAQKVSLSILSLHDVASALFLSYAPLI